MYRACLGPRLFLKGAVAKPLLAATQPHPLHPLDCAVLAFVAARLRCAGYSEVSLEVEVPDRAACRRCVFRMYGGDSCLR